MPKHLVSVRGPLWDRAKTYAVLREMTVGDLVENLISNTLNAAGFGENGPEAIRGAKLGPEAKNGPEVKPEDKTEPKN